jgi:hypothetical protein
MVMIKGANTTRIYRFGVICGEMVVLPLGNSKNVPLEFTIVAIGSSELVVVGFAGIGLAVEIEDPLVVVEVVVVGQGAYIDIHM